VFFLRTESIFEHSELILECLRKECSEPFLCVNRLCSTPISVAVGLLRRSEPGFLVHLRFEPVTRVERVFSELDLSGSLLF
jgi:hypothetical protein